MIYHPLTCTPGSHWIRIKKISCVRKPLPAATRVKLRKDWAQTLLLLTRTDTLRQEPQPQYLQLFLMDPDNPVDLAMNLRDADIIRAVLEAVEQKLTVKYCSLRYKLFTVRVDLPHERKKAQKPAGGLFDTE